MSIAAVPSLADSSALGTALKAELVEAGLDPEQLLTHIRFALAEDLPADPALGAAAGVDTTSYATLGADQRAVAHFNAREPGVVSGLGLAALVFAEVMGDTVEVSHRVADGARVASGDRVMTVAGPVRGLLTAERTALNFASHLSAISTATSHWVKALEGTNAQVLDTRKTLPGWRALQKYAVRTGGGVNHRFSLSDMAMVKDNHAAAAGGVVPALEAVRRTFPGLPVEVEVDTLDALRELLEVGVERVLLDNMSTATMREAVEIAAGRAVLEASGGLTLQRAREVALTGVDFISVGALTHSVVVFDLGLDLQED
jgi:nicotinate-nucleotide pyrophosphorylase (carboxylating)